MNKDKENISSNLGPLKAVVLAIFRLMVNDKNVRYCPRLECLEINVFILALFNVVRFGVKSAWQHEREKKLIKATNNKNIIKLHISENLVN